jgi:hypothetical protein
MKTEPLITNAGLGDINLSTLNSKYLALDSVRTDNAHVKEFLRNFQSEFWQAHKIKVHHSVKVTKERLVRDRVIVFINKKQNFTSINDVLKLVRKYNFPEKYVSRLTSEYKNCSCIMFAIEADGDVAKYKIYCEIPFQNFGFGFKWTKSNSVITRYDWSKKVDNYKSLIDASGFNLYPKFLETKKITLVYSVKDETTSKRGFEFALEDTYLKDISRDVSNLTHVNIYDKLKDLANLPIIHFSGGVESNGDKYFNLYFVVI